MYTNSLSDLHIQVQAVVEVSAPEEVSEAKANVKGTKLLVTQRKQSEDVDNVLVPPRCVNMCHILDLK